MNGNKLYRALKPHFAVENMLSLIVIFVGIVILYLSHFAGIRQYGIGFAFFIGGVIPIFLKNKNILLMSIYTKKYGNRIDKILNIIYINSILVSILILYTSVYTRSVAFFLLISIAFLSVFIEIIFTKIQTKEYIILFKIIIVSLVLRAGRIYNYATIPGSDIHFHLKIIELITQNGFIPSYDIADKYAYTPLFHIYGAINTILGDLNFDDLIFYYMVIVIVVCLSLFMYIVIKRLFNVHIALISVILINIADMIFVKTCTNIDTSLMVMIFFVTMLFLVIKSKKPQFSAILILCLISMILAHQLSTFLVFVIMSTFVISKMIYAKWNKKISKYCNKCDDINLNLYANTIYFMTVSMISYWSVTGPAEGTTFFNKMVYRLDRTISSMINDFLNDTTIVTSHYETFFSSQDMISSILYSSGQNILLMLAIAGFLFAIYNKKISTVLFTFMCTLVILFCLIYGGTYIGLGHLFIPHRFLPFFQLFLIVFASYTLFIFIYNCGKNQTNLIPIIIMFLLIFFSITAPYLNRGNSFYATNQVERDQFYLSEVIPLEWSNNHIEDVVYVDHFMYHRPLSTIQKLNLSKDRIAIYDTKKDDTSNYILMREYIRADPRVIATGTFGYANQKDYNQIIRESYRNNAIYSNNEVVIYKARKL